MPDGGWFLRKRKPSNEPLVFSDEVSDLHPRNLRSSVFLAHMITCPKRVSGRSDFRVLSEALVQQQQMWPLCRGRRHELFHRHPIALAGTFAGTGHVLPGSRRDHRVNAKSVHKSKMNEVSHSLRFFIEINLASRSILSYWPHLEATHTRQVIVCSVSSQPRPFKANASLFSGCHRHGGMTP